MKVIDRWGRHFLVKIRNFEFNLIEQIFRKTNSVVYSIPSNVVVQIHKESDSPNLSPTCDTGTMLALKAKIS